MNFHPGGTEILRQWAGEDCTAEFKQHHHDWERCLRDFDYLRIGRVISEKYVGELTDQEIAIHGHIYSLQGESLLPEMRTFKKIKKDFVSNLNTYPTEVDRMVSADMNFKISHYNRTGQT